MSELVPFYTPFQGGLYESRPDVHTVAPLVRKRVADVTHNGPLYVAMDVYSNKPHDHVKRMPSRTQSYKKPGGWQDNALAPIAAQANASRFRTYLSAIADIVGGKHS